MSELDTSLQELRDDLRSSITRPGLARIAGRARQRETRRRMQIGAITAVVLVSVAVPVLRSLPSEDRRTATPPPSVRYQVDFANATHGFALGSDCVRSTGPCTFTLLATTNAGENWQPRTMPVDGTKYDGAQIGVLDQERLVIQAYKAGQGPDPVRYASDDAGRTWNGEEFNAANSAGGDEPALRLQTPPPLVDPQQAETPTAGGRHWAVGRDQSTGQWTIAVTSNKGVTWATTLVDLPGEPYRGGTPWSMVENDGVLYLTVVGSIGVGPFGLLAVYRSTNKGVSWTETWRGSQTNVLIAVDGSAVATNDGRLLIYSAVDGTLESRDGRTFTRAKRQLLGPVTWTRAGYLAAGKNNRYELSSDGRKWRSFDVR